MVVSPVDETMRVKEVRDVEERTKIQHEYELMGKKFYASDFTINNIRKIADLCDVRWFTLYGFSGMAEYLYGVIENEFEKEMRGRKPTPDMWPEIIGLMLRDLKKTAEDYTDSEGKVNESEIISDYLSVSASGDAYWITYL